MTHHPATGHERKRVGLDVVLLALVIVGAALLLVAVFAPAIPVAASMVGTLGDEMGRFPPLPDELAPPAERSVVYARDGSELAVLRTENRSTVSLAEIPEHVRNAVIATEDADFYRHRGVSWTAIARAALGNVRAGEITSGASTITQQLVKNVVLDDTQSLDRKLHEAVYALELEQRLGKDEILEAYLNEAYFGNGVYGIGTAAEYYWGRSVSELTVDEGALLAGMVRSPERNDPTAHPDAALARRNIVLDQMVREGLLTERERERYRQMPLELDVHQLSEPGYPFFVDYVRQLLRQDPALGPDPETRGRTVLRGGLEIHTTLDPRLQQVAQEAVLEVLEDPDGPVASLTAVDPRTGEVLAIGFGPKPYGKGPGQTEVLPAVPGMGSTHGRQPGSAFKAFQVVTALEDGIPPTLEFDAAAEHTSENPACGSDYTVENYGGTAHGTIDMVEATARSSNTYFLHLLDQTGPERLVETARRMGIDRDLEPYCSLVLGAQEVFPLEMTAAFGTLANGGVHCEPFAIARVVDRHDRTISRSGDRCGEAVDERVAAQATAVLRAPIEDGTAARHGQINRPAAGKTGTTDEARDAWFVGYIPQLVAAAWVGHEQPERLTDERCGGEVTGGCLPTMIWQRFMSRAVEELDLEIEPFPDPPPLPRATIPSVVGMSERRAVERLEDAGFATSTRTVTSHRPAGTVVDQDPDGGSRAALGTRVELGISDGTGSPPAPGAAPSPTPAEPRTEPRDAPPDDTDDAEDEPEETPSPEPEETPSPEPEETPSPEPEETPSPEPEETPVPSPSPPAEPSPSPPAEPSPSPPAEPSPSPPATPAAPPSSGGPGAQGEPERADGAEAQETDE